MLRHDFLRPLAFSSLLIFSSNVSAALNGHCPPLGPVLPAPIHPSSHAMFASAVKAIETAFQNATASFNDSALSISAMSIHESTPLFDLHHTPDILDPAGVSKVDAQSVYRIGSLSKMLTVATVLKLCGVDLNDPVTKHLPELRKLKQQQEVNNAITTVDWDSITLGALASHQSGVGVDYATDLAHIPGNWTSLGLPEIDPKSIPMCAGFLGLRPCNRTDFFATIGKQTPVFAPFTTPVYSQIGISILAFVVEEVAKTTFADFLDDKVLQPLNMTHTSVTKPADGLGVIPAGTRWWNGSIGFQDPAGGMYSSTADLLAFGAGVLSHRLLGPAATRRWMKPMTLTSSAGTALGAGWEILRADAVTSDGRLVDFYTKTGDLGDYHGILVLVPDYDLVVTVLGAGRRVSSPRVTYPLLTRVVNSLLPAVEAAGRAEARAAYAGTYADPASNSTLTLALDGPGEDDGGSGSGSGGPGLAVAEWVVRGTDVIRAYPTYRSLLSAPDPDAHVDARLYPTNLETAGAAPHASAQEANRTTKATKQAWRTVFEFGGAEERAALDASTFWSGSSCTTWGEMDRVVYAYNSVDEVVFNMAAGAGGAGHGVADSVDLAGFGVTLKRVA